jgi:hypothetical protein
MLKANEAVAAAVERAKRQGPASGAKEAGGQGAAWQQWPDWDNGHADGQWHDAPISEAISPSDPK